MCIETTERRLPEPAENLIGEFGTVRLSKVAKALDISRTTLASEIEAGRLPARYAGRAVLIARADLVRWLNELPTQQPFKGKAKLAASMK